MLAVQTTQQTGEAVLRPEPVCEAGVHWVLGFFLDIWLHFWEYT
jgi:hypothetical protein